MQLSSRFPLADSAGSVLTFSRFSNRVRHACLAPPHREQYTTCHHNWLQTYQMPKRGREAARLGASAVGGAASMEDQVAI